jgi:BirA family biotin operon repressor/biotin-[acetyl-CoA-carboxylase] ligase
MYSKEELQKGLYTHIFGKKLFVYEIVSSTNTWAKKIAAIGAEEGTVVIADYQTEGRGRIGRTWISESGSNLLFSIIIRPRLDATKASLLTFFAAVGVSYAIEGSTNLHCECKWPNDVLINGQKCCGILLESAYKNNILDYTIIGIGLNVNQKDFGNDLNGKATSLYRECGKEFERKEIFHRVLVSLESIYPDVKKGYFDMTIREWNSRAKMLGKNITLTQNSEVVSGRAVGLDSDGGLIVETREGERVFHAGTVTILK